MRLRLVWGLLATVVLTSLVAVVLMPLACSEEAFRPMRKPATKYLYDETVSADVFKDEAPANIELRDDGFPSSFIDCHGEKVDLSKYHGKKNVLLVVLRGYNGAHCPYCTAQTNSLFKNQADLDKHDAQLLIVYPGKSNMLSEFVTRAGSSLMAAPCPILLDENFQAVDQLGIRGSLAKPSTYIIDKQGHVRYAYVGASLSDRPSVKAILTHLAQLEEKPPAAGS